MARANYLWLVLACVLFGVTYMLAAVRWWFLMRVQKINVSLRVAAALTLIGQFYNSFMLGAIGGDIVKVVYLQKYAPRQKTQAALSIVMDRVLGPLRLLCASLLSLPWQLRSLMQKDQASDAIVGLLIAFSVIVAGAIAMATFPFHRAPESLRAIWRRFPAGMCSSSSSRGFGSMVTRCT
jgi:uncharacterized protein (TIRG00374 family)